MICLLQTGMNMGLTDMTKAHVSHTLLRGKCVICGASKDNPFDMLKLLSPCKGAGKAAAMHVEPENNNGYSTMLETA